jgi:hypothetical protein
MPLCLCGEISPPEIRVYLYPSVIEPFTLPSLSLTLSDLKINFFIFPTRSHFSPTPCKYWLFFIKTARYRPPKNPVFRQNAVSQKRELSISSI